MFKDEHKIENNVRNGQEHNNHNQIKSNQIKSNLLAANQSTK